ncbi:hypothetical protein LLH23_04880 [bacterium]|nr:hypothetical protein [bacterium]
MTGKQFRVLAVLTVVSGFFGGAVSNLLLQGAPVHAQAGKPVQEVVRARRFEVVDQSGRRQAALESVSNGTAQLELLGSKGAGCVQVGSCLGRPAISLWDADGKVRASLDLDPKGNAALCLFNSPERGGLIVKTTGLRLVDNAGKERCSLGPSGLELSDATGGLRACLGATATVNKTTGATTTYPESTLTLFAADGTVCWQAPAAPAAIAPPLRPPAAAPGASQYLGGSSGHWMRPKLEGGQSVALDDGSLWEVGVRDRLNTMLWLLNEDIMVTENGGEYPLPLQAGQYGLERCSGGGADRLRPVSFPLRSHGVRADLAAERVECQ